MTVRLVGVDVGGTFTDLALWDGRTGTVSVHKLLTTPEDPTRAIVAGLAALGDRMDGVIHGTTLISNALIERRGARVGLVTTEGFRDTLEIGSELRYDTFDLFLERPAPLVPRPLRLAVRERIGAGGEEVLALDEAGVRAAGRALAATGVEAIAVAFFNAYRNPEHERRAARLLTDDHGALAVCAACDIAPEIREYERTSTAVANAYVQPLAARYLLRLGEVVRAPLFVVRSDGGMTTAQEAAARPITVVESGPAAGTMAAAHLSGEAGWPEVIAFDMGGTTAKISLIHAGVPERTHAMEVARVHRFKKGSGLPLRVPAVQLIEIGAGGGSVARLDGLGLLKVGPESAGAVPGPACYGLGGLEPTVTDADLHLGYLHPERFLGGRMALDVGRAEAALGALGGSLALDVTAVAAGIHEVVNNNMATAARIHIAEGGRDPRRYRLVAFGGAGPVHAYGLARLLHVREVSFPRAAGVASAVGMLVAPRSVEYTRSLVSPIAGLDWHQVAAALAELEAGARGLLGDAGAAQGEIRLELSADMRYVGQGSEVTVPLPAGVVAQGDAAALMAAFEAEYRRRFDRIVDAAPVEVVSWRLRAVAPPPVRSVRFEAAPGSQGPALVETRRAYFPEAKAFLPTPVYDRSRLTPGETIVGPALVEEADTTVVAGPAARIRLERDGNLTMLLD